MLTAESHAVELRDRVKAAVCRWHASVKFWGTVAPVFCVDPSVPGDDGAGEGWRARSCSGAQCCARGAPSPADPDALVEQLFASMVPDRRLRHPLLLSLRVAATALASAQHLSALQAGATVGRKSYAEASALLWLTRSAAAHTPVASLRCAVVWLACCVCGWVGLSSRGAGNKPA